MEDFITQFKALQERVYQLEKKQGSVGGAGVDTGSIIAFPSDTLPTGYLVCDGSAVSRSTYADLFSIIGTTYGSGDGSTTFNVPNLKGKVVVGKNSSDTDFDALGETGGEKTHTLTVAEMPSHTHTQDAHTHTQNSHYHTGQQLFRLATSPSPAYNGEAMCGSSGAYTSASGFNFAPSFNTGSTTATNQNATATNQNTGGDGAHNNLQPYIVLNFAIKT